METIKIIEGITEAIKTLDKASKENTSGSTTIWRMTDHAKTHLDRQIAELLAPDHAKDSDCTVNPDTDLCTVCGVMRCDPCPVCGGRSFHLDGCDESDATPNNRHQREAEQRTRTGNTPTELLDPESEEAEALLDAVKEAQTAYWNALHELEEATGLDIDGTQDFQGMTCADLTNQ